jgi:hypothetical protein
MKLAEIIKRLYERIKSGLLPGSNSKPVSSSRSLTYLLLTLIMASSLYFLILSADVYEEVKVNPPYLMLAIIGVIFHMTSKMREIRDSGQAFVLQEYWFDYLFRAFQACIYVFIITNLLDTGTNERTIVIPISPENLDELKRNLDDSLKQSLNHIKPGNSEPSDFSYKFAVLSLFIGMYIRRVEEAFVSFGDTFGNSISSILGTRITKLLPDEKRLRTKKLHSEFLDIKAALEELTPRPDEEWREAFEDDLISVHDQLNEGRLDAASSLLLKLELRLDEYERLHETSSGSQT